MKFGICGYLNLLIPKQLSQRVLHVPIVNDKCLKIDETLSWAIIRVVRGTKAHVEMLIFS